jgi:eukaryotic-like serine/threonine-protein kinase
MTDLPPPISHLGRYDIVRVLGQGAMGVVYEGRDPNLDRRVAIKTVRVVGMAAAEVAEYEQRFKTEARSAGRLQHPNIVSVYDSNKHEDAHGKTAYIVMEFVQGEDLKHFLDAGKRFTLEQTAFMMADLLSALDYAHKHKIIHRDIKPANMLLTKEGRIKLTDFGVARITDSGEATKTSGGTVGTLKYMSPEQVAGRGVDSSSDLFSAGIVLYQLLTGVRPFDGEGYLDIVSKIVKEDPMPPSRMVGALPPSLDAVVAKALAKSKLDRFADAAAFAAALKSAMNNADLTITPSAHPRPELAESVGTFPGSLSGSGGSTVTQELELVYWKDIKESSEPEVLEGFLKRFPIGIYADLAKRKLKSVVQAKNAAGEASRYEATMLRKPGDSTMLSTSQGKVITGAVSTLAASDATLVSGSNADDSTLPPSAYNDSEYGASTQFAPTQFPATDPGSVQNASGALSAQAKSKSKMASMPLEADLVKKAASAAPKKSSKYVLWAALVTLVIGAGVFVSSLKPVPQQAAVPEPAITATAIVSTPAEATPTLPSTMITEYATDSAIITSSKTSTATASPTMAVASSVAAMAASAASAAKAVMPARRSSAPASSPSAAPISGTQPEPGNPQPAQVAAPPANTPTTAPSRTSTPTIPRSSSGVSGPREACEGRVLFGFQACMNEQCERAFSNHPACVERREMEERRKAQEQSR